MVRRVKVPGGTERAVSRAERICAATVSKDEKRSCMKGRKPGSTLSGGQRVGNWVSVGAPWSKCSFVDEPS